MNQQLRLGVPVVPPKRFVRLPQKVAPVFSRVQKTLNLRNLSKAPGLEKWLAPERNTGERAFLRQDRRDNALIAASS
jgi:hypothetical protein